MPHAYGVLFVTCQDLEENLLLVEKEIERMKSYYDECGNIFRLVSRRLELLQQLADCEVGTTATLAFNLHRGAISFFFSFSIADDF